MNLYVVFTVHSIYYNLEFHHSSLLLLKWGQKYSKHQNYIKFLINLTYVVRFDWSSFECNKWEEIFQTIQNSECV